MSAKIKDPIGVKSNFGEYRVELKGNINADIPALVNSQFERVYAAAN